MIRFGERTHDEKSATLELFHLYAAEAGWNLDIALDGSLDRIALEGRVQTPALPGPSALVVWYVDAPRVVTLDGEHGTLTVGERDSDNRPLAPTNATVTSLAPGRVRIDGTLTLVWQPLGGGDTRSFAIELALDAALIT